MGRGRHLDARVSLLTPPKIHPPRTQRSEDANSEPTQSDAGVALFRAQPFWWTIGYRTATRHANTTVGKLQTSRPMCGSGPQTTRCEKRKASLPSTSLTCQATLDRCDLTMTLVRAPPGRARRPWTTTRARATAHRSAKGKRSATGPWRALRSWISLGEGICLRALMMTVVRHPAVPLAAARGSAQSYRRNRAMMAHACGLPHDCAAPAALWNSDPLSGRGVSGTATNKRRPPQNLPVLGHVCPPQNHVRPYSQRWHLIIHVSG